MALDSNNNNSGTGRTLFKEALLFLWEVAKVILISLAIIIPVRYFLIQPFYVKGASMEPNFHDHEYLIVDQLTYRFEGPQRGQVVVFRYPRDPREYFIKRIIGLPGETVRVEGQVITIFDETHVNGVKLSEAYLPPYPGSYGSLEVRLGKDEYFLMGDNRPESLDSRVFGPVKRTSIVGKVLLRGWPLSKFSFYINHPEYSI